MNIQIEIKNMPNFKIKLQSKIDKAPLLEEVKLNDQKIKIMCETLPQVGNVIMFSKGSQIMQMGITSVEAFDEKKYEITIDSPADMKFPVDSKSVLGNDNLVADGSQELVKYSLIPEKMDDDEVFLLERVIFYLEDVKEMDTGKFGGINKLKNGTILRIAGNDPMNIINAKNNKDFGLNGFKMVFPKRHPSESYVFFAKMDLGMSVAKDSEVELIIQDDLKTLDKLMVLVHGTIIKL